MRVHTVGRAAPAPPSSEWKKKYFLVLRISRLQTYFHTCVLMRTYTPKFLKTYAEAKQSLKSGPCRFLIVFRPDHR